MGINFTKSSDKSALMAQLGITPEVAAQGKKEATTITPITNEQFGQWQQSNGAAFPGQYAVNLEDMGLGTGWGLLPLSTVQQMWNSQPREDDGGGFLKGLANAANEMKGGLSVMAAPFLAAAGSGAFSGAGAGAAEGAGLEAGATLFPGESATSGFAGTGGSGSLVAGAEDPLGGFNIDPNTGDVFSGTGENPFGSNFSGGSGNEFFNGMDQTSPGMLEGMQAKAQELAKQFGISPASALQALMKAAGKAAPAALGVIGSKNQADSLSALADKYMSLGEPSRARYEASFAPGFTMMNDPGYKEALDQSSKATLHGLSVSGNPAGSPNAWAKSLQDLYEKTAYPALQNFRNTNANAGGIASLQTAAPGAATGAINAQKGIYDSIGGGLNDIFNQPESLADQLIKLKKAGVY